MTADADGHKREDVTARALTRADSRGPSFLWVPKGPFGLWQSCSQALPPRRGGEGPFRRVESHCALSRFRPTYTFQMLFVLPASHGLGPSDKLVLWTYVVAIMGMLTSRSPCWGQAACTPPLCLAASALRHTHGTPTQSPVRSWAFHRVLALTVPSTGLTLQVCLCFGLSEGRQLSPHSARYASLKTVDSRTVSPQTHKLSRS